MLKSSLISGMLIAASLSPANAVTSGLQAAKAISEAVDGATPVVWRLRRHHTGGGARGHQRRRAASLAERDNRGPGGYRYPAPPGFALRG
jgi:hypothetical protein